MYVYSTQTVVFINTYTAHEEVRNTCECAHTSTHLTAAPSARQQQTPSSSCSLPTQKQFWILSSLFSHLCPLSDGSIGGHWLLPYSWIDRCHTWQPLELAPMPSARSKYFRVHLLKDSTVWSWTMCTTTAIEIMYRYGRVVIKILQCKVWENGNVDPQN